MSFITNTSGAGPPPATRSLQAPGVCQAARRVDRTGPVGTRRGGPPAAHGEHEGDDQPDSTANHQDQAYERHVHVGEGPVDGVPQDCAGHYKCDAPADSHGQNLLSSRCSFAAPSLPSSIRRPVRVSAAPEPKLSATV